MTDGSLARSRSAADRRFEMTALAAFAVVVAIMSILHEPWNDEAQAWLRAKELIWPDQYLVIPGEGHPPGWRFIQYERQHPRGRSDA